jgi:UDP-N-acetylglucosamine 2-epimerase (non-hydrolysing)
VPNVTIRDVTERPETLECGSNILSGADHDTILRCVKIVMSHSPVWVVPPEYLRLDVSSAVVRIVMGYSRVSEKTG